MKIAYIILAYNKPGQLCRLISRLNHPDAAFYVHIDKKSNFSDFKNEFDKLPGTVNLNFLPRKIVYWGGFGMVLATLNGLTQIVKEDKYQRIILLSGQDYPIKSNNSIFEFFESNEDKNYIPYFKLPSEEWVDGGMSRIENYHFRILGKKLTYPPISDPIHIHSKLFYKLLRLRFSKPRIFPEGLTAYGGFSWWRITNDAAKEILTFLEERPDFIEFHKYSHIADEMFFQTILLNSKSDATLNSLVNSDISFITWKHGNPHPKLVTAADFENIKKSSSLFARKFDAAIDSKILNMIDEKILSL